MKKTIFLVFAVLLVTVSFVSAETTPNPTVIDVSSFTLLDDPILGDTVSVQVVFVSNIDDTLWMGISYDDIYEATDTAYSGNRIFNYQVVEESSTYTINYSLVVQDTGMARIYFDAMNLSPNIINGMPKEFLDDVSLGLASHTDPTAGQELDLPFANFNYHEHLTTNFLESSPNTQYTFNITGKVTYRDWNRFDGTVYYPTYSYVRLWFRKKTDPWLEDRWILYHPVPLDGSGGSLEYVEGTHYAECDKDGEYHFEFSFSDLEFDDEEDWEILIFASLENDVIFMTQTEVYNFVENDNLDYRSKSLLAEHKESRLTYNIVGNQYSYTFTNADLKIDKLDGMSLRYNKIANEFIKDVFDDEPSFDLPVIDFRIVPPNWSSGGYQPVSPKYIEFNREANQQVITRYHEYGHYVHHAMQNLGGAFPGSEFFYEGFARFFAEECQQWATNNYDYEYYNANYSYEADP